MLGTGSYNVLTGKPCWERGWGWDEVPHGKWGGKLQWLPPVWRLSPSHAGVHDQGHFADVLECHPKELLYKILMEGI